MGNSLEQYRGAIGSFMSRISSVKWLKNCTTKSRKVKSEKKNRFWEKCASRELAQEINQLWNWTNILFILLPLLVFGGIFCSDNLVMKVLSLFLIPEIAQTWTYIVKELDLYLNKNKSQIWSAGLNVVDHISVGVLSYFLLFDLPNDIITSNITLKKSNFQCGFGPNGSCEVGWGFNEVPEGLVGTLTRQLIGLLLVMSGDVEINPGPKQTPTPLMKNTEGKQSTLYQEFIGIGRVLTIINDNYGILGVPMKGIGSERNVHHVLFDICDFNQDLSGKRLNDLIKIGDFIEVVALKIPNMKSTSQRNIDLVATYVVPFQNKPEQYVDMIQSVSMQLNQQKLENFMIVSKKANILPITWKELEIISEINEGKFIILGKKETFCTICGQIKKTKYCKCQQSHQSPAKLRKSFSSTEAVKIDNLVSVRLHSNAPTVRTFVDLTANKCYASDCMDFSTVNKSNCGHIEKAKHCQLDADVKTLNLTLNGLKAFGFSETQAEQIFKYDQGITKVFRLNQITGAKTVIVKSYQDPSHESPLQFIHIINGKCELTSCKTKSQHAKIEKKPICIHTMIAAIAEEKVPIKLKPKGESALLDQDKTANKIIDELVSTLPQLHDSSVLNQFYRRSDEFAQTNLDVSQYSITNCEQCGKELTLWKYQRSCHLIQMGSIREIKTKIQHCKECKIIYYPKVSQLGLIHLHNRCLISFEFILDIYEQMKLGSPLCQYIETRLNLLLSKTEPRLDIGSLHNLAHNIQQLCVAILSLMITGDSLDYVMCIICGMWPKIVATDGNSKDVTEIDAEFMYFEKNDDPLYTLPELKILLVKEIVKMSFFQNPSRVRINMLKLPHIMAPKAMGTMCNNEQLKKSQFDEETMFFKDVNINNFVGSLGSHEDVDITSLKKLSLEQLKKIADDSNIKYLTNSTKQNLIEKFKAVQYFICSGGSNTHQYTSRQKYTGGWQDCWCEHCVKYVAKMEARQESCIDAVDAVHSLKKIPPVHIVDDACGVVNNELSQYPQEAKKTLGLKRRGCFEEVNPNKKPNRGTSCDQNGECCKILQPSGYKTEKQELQISEDPLVHPDTGSSKRFILGHKLGAKKATVAKKKKNKKKESHQSKSCAYHDILLCRKGNFVKTMHQEALQVKRKRQRVKSDRNHSFPMSYLFNYVLDFAHNQQKYKTSVEKIEKDGKFKYAGRNILSWRAETTPTTEVSHTN